MPPLISVIVPVYNAEKYLSRCLNSIIKQSYLNIEIILVNDGSQDSSAAICDKYVKSNKNIKVIHKNNEGTSSARNIGLKEAKGSYITFVDSDDWIDERMYEVMMKYIMKYNIDMVECYLEKKNVLIDSKKEYFLNEDLDNALKHITTPGFYHVINKIYSAKIINGLTFIYGKVHQDALFNSEVYKRIKRRGLINEAFYHYNETNESITRTEYNLKKIDGIDVINETIINLCNLPVSKETINIVKKNYLNYLQYHYHALIDNPKLDLRQEKLKEVRLLIQSNYVENTNIYLKLINYLPSPIYKVFHYTNNFRIKFLQKKSCLNLRK